MASAKNPVATIFSLLRSESKEITAVYFYAILNGLIQLSLPLGIQAIIGYAMGASIRASLIVLIILVVCGVLLAGIMQVNQMKVIEKIQQKLFVRYSFAFIDHLPKLDLKKVDHIYLPELLNRFFDISVLQKSLSKILLDIPAASIQVLFGLILLSFYHSAFVLFGVLLIAVLILLLRSTGARGLETSIEESNYKYKTAAWLQETGRAIKSIKASRKNDLHAQRLDTEVSNYLDARNAHFKILLLQYNTLVAFKTVIIAVMLVAGTLLLVRQQLTVGQFVAAEIVIVMVLNSVEKLIINLSAVYDTVTAKEKITSVTENPIERNGQLPLQPGESGMKVELRNISFSYDDKENVLENLSMTVPANGKFCIIGSNTSGKSTLLQLIAGTYTDFAGQYLLNDIPLGNYNLDYVRSKTGILISEQEIVKASVWDNITLGDSSISVDTVTYFARKVGLNQFIDSLPQGYDTMVDSTGRRLPKSVANRILLVRALASKPSLLLLEEPWLYCEKEQRVQIVDTLLELTNTTVIVASTDPEFAKRFDMAIVLDRSTNNSKKN